VEAVRAAFDSVCDGFYLERYRELEAAELLPAAEALARAFLDAGGSTLSKAVVDETMRQAGAGRPERLELVARGFIWQSLDPSYREDFGTVNVFEPGIPSLMTWLLEQTGC